VVPGVKVLYVMSHGWSGSTILGNVLGELPGFFHAGELRTLWGEALPEGRVCGCGLTIGSCEVWTAILRTGFGEPASPSPGEIAAWHRKAARVRHTRRLLRLQAGGPTGSPALDAYLPVEGRLYAAIAEVTGSRVVVDSSKRTGDAAILRLMPGVDPFFVHLVRDPRAVAYSWRVRDSRHGPLQTMREWTVANLSDEAVRRSDEPGRSIRVRYEDFVARPRATVEAVVALVGEWPSDLPFLDEHTVDLRVHHTVGGNPSRFERGRVRLVNEEAWRAKLSSTDRLAVAALAWPLMLRYRYPIRFSKRS
jgi:hypothetical protein